MFRLIQKGFWWLEDECSVRKKSKLEDNLGIGNDTTNTKAPTEVSLKKAPALKPLKRVNQTLNTAASQTPPSKSDKKNHHMNESTASEPNTQTGRNGIPERRRSAEGSSNGHPGNVSPGDTAGVKDVANVVVKYLNPHLKTGSIVSKVTILSCVQ